MILVPPVRIEELLRGGTASRGLGIGARSAYPDLLCLEATWQALEDSAAFPTLQIPRHNRALVERSCSDGALSSLAANLGQAWQEHWKVLKGHASAQGSQALYSSFDWLKEWHKAAPGELGAEARTRLGLDGVDLELPQPWEASPFGQRIDRLTVPAWMLPPGQDQRALPTMSNVQAAESVLRFEVRGWAFVYDRFGLAISPASSAAGQ